MSEPCVFCVRGSMLDTAALHHIYDWRGDTWERVQCTDPANIARVILNEENRLKYYCDEIERIEKHIAKLKGLLPL